MLIVFAAVATASIYAGDASTLLGLIGVLALTVPVCGLASILNTIVFHSVKTFASDAKPLFCFHGAMAD